MPTKIETEPTLPKGSLPFVNIAAYKFVALEDLPTRREALRDYCVSLDLKGSILLSPEGINLFLAGTPQSIAAFIEHLRSFDEFHNLEIKESPSDHQPFRRMLVRLKKEIISMGVEGIDPVNKPSAKLPARELAEWIRSGKQFHFLDTRNGYEVEVGTFENAVDLGIDSFREFPKAIEKLPETWKREPIVMFCTGGIRCEKAGPLMEREGFEQIFQLEGGILKYFEECKGLGYEGDCFVFDKRVAVNPTLCETEDGLCYACQAVLSPEDQEHPHYYPPHSCPHCYKSPAELMQIRMRERELQIAAIANPLPGSVPYENIRPINVSERFDRLTVLELLTTLHGHVPASYWESECDHGYIRSENKTLSRDSIVRAGWRLEHVIPLTVEPDVNASISMLFEDDYLIAVDKPAPLPMHPCGRFNRNSLVTILDRVYAPNRLRLLHRLDANTTGVVVLARTKEAARLVQPQFVAGQIKKTYVALVNGHPQTETFNSELSIGRSPTVAGGRFADTESGLPCRTEFRVLAANDYQSLIECRPITGRTNQIRIHLASLGLPIVGDPLYRSPADCSDLQKAGIRFDDPKQTLSVDSPPLCLHSCSIEFAHPKRGEKILLEAALPLWAGL